MAATLLKRRSATGTAGERRIAKARRHFRVRKKVRGTAERPRLVVTRSLRHIHAQLVDDTAGNTLVAFSSIGLRSAGPTEGDKKAAARRVGQRLAEMARERGISAVVFDRGGNRYHGRIAALADAAREGGLEF